MPHNNADEVAERDFTGSSTPTPPWRRPPAVTRSSSARTSPWSATTDDHAESAGAPATDRQIELALTGMTCASCANRIAYRAELEMRPTATSPRQFMVGRARSEVHG